MMYNLQIRHFIAPVLCLLFTLFSCQKNYLVNLDETKFTRLLLPWVFPPIMLK